MLIGNLTRDPNLRYTPSQTPVCSFGLATNRAWTSGESGEKEERVDFHNIVAWSKLAEICAQLLHKGDKVYVEGRIQTRDWKTDDGSDRRITEIVIDNMILLGNPKGGGAEMNMESGEEVSEEPKKARKSKKVAEETTEQPAAAASTEEEVVDDIPF